MDCVRVLYDFLALFLEIGLLNRPDKKECDGHPRSSDHHNVAIVNLLCLPRQLSIVAMTRPDRLSLSLVLGIEGIGLWSLSYPSSVRLRGNRSAVDWARH